MLLTWLSPLASPLASALSRSDWYVILSFLFAFSIILVQTLAELGIYDEAAGAFEIRREDAGSSDNAAGLSQEAWTEDSISVPAPLIIGGSAWGGFHIIVLCVWGVFYARRIFINPTNRKCVGKRWGMDGVDWYEPEMASMRNLLVNILPGGPKEPARPTRESTKRRVLAPGGSAQTTSGISTELSSHANSHANSPREGYDRGLASSSLGARSWASECGAEGYRGPTEDAVRT